MCNVERRIWRWRKISTEGDFILMKFLSEDRGVGLNRDWLGLFEPYYEITGYDGDSYLRAFWEVLF